MASVNAPVRVWVPHVVGIYVKSIRTVDVRRTSKDEYVTVFDTVFRNSAQIRSADFQVLHSSSDFASFQFSHEWVRGHANLWGYDTLLDDLPRKYELRNN